jgi:gamma-D-glutamyl-L-lysine dipeptidyl-peptidase
MAGTWKALLLAGALVLGPAGPLATAQAPPSQRIEIEMTDILSPEDEGAAPVEIRRGVAMGARDGKSREQRTYERAIATVEPTLKGDPARLSVYTELFRREFLSDPRIFASDVKATQADDGTIVLEGYVNFSESHHALGRLFHYLGFENVRNEVEVLPSQALGEKLFAIVATPNLYAWSSPTEPRERVTQALLGDPVYLLREAQDGHFLCQTAEGYVGYVDGSALHRVAADEFTHWRGGDRAVMLNSMDVDENLFLPMGARLKLAAHGEDTVMVEVPGRGRIPVPRPMVAIRSSAPNPIALAALEAGKNLLGTVYAWGGKSREGIDCSGLVQTSFLTQGINLPRDSYQQAFVGELSSTRWYPQGMGMGDLIFFLGDTGKIVHVGIHIQDGLYLEASGSVKFTSINPAHENYDERRARTFCFTKRVLQ